MNIIATYVRENHILAALLVVSAVWVLWILRDVLFVLLLAFIFMAALHPVATFLQRNKIPRVLAVLIPLLLVVGIIGGGIALLAPPVMAEVESLSTTLPGYLDQAIQASGFATEWSGLRTYAIQNVSGIGQGLINVTSVIASSFFALLMATAISVYLLLDRQHVIKFLASLAPRTYKDRLPAKMDRIQHGIGAWVRGQFVVSLIVAVAVWILLSFLGVPYAILWALLAGVLDPIPFIGPILASIPAIIIGLSVSPLIALFVALGYFVIQQVQAFVFVPMVMEKAVGLHPLAVIVGVLVGGTLGGIMGAFLAVPLLVIGRLAFTS